MRTAETLVSNRCSASSLCAYHEARVGISEIPPPNVYAQPQLEEIKRIVSHHKNDTNYSHLPVDGQLRTVLNLVNDYWVENRQLLDGQLRSNYVQWSQDTEKRGKFPAHGWMASPQQFSQLVESLKVLREEEVPLNRWLLLGTASNANTAQLVEPLQRTNIAPTLFILDQCESPIRDSLISSRFGLAANALELPISNESVQAVSIHFTTSFIPTEEQRIAEDLDRTDVIELKKRLFQEVYRVLADDGVFVGAVGTPIGFPNSDEIINAATHAGFIGENIILVPTTDPTCYDTNTKKHIPKNFFLIAIKKETVIPPIQLRDYNPKTDYPAVRQILEEGKLFNPVWDSEERLSMRIKDRPDSIIIATYNGAVVGNTFIIDDFYPYVFRLAVKGTHRGRGIGKQLMNEAIKRIKKHGHEQAGVYVDDDNEELKAWYRKMGFNESSKHVRRMWKKI